jgi:Primase X
MALSKILKNIESELSSEPTVIWSGNGRHIIQPMDAFILEELDLFSPTVIGTDQPSVKFLRWTEEYLSGGKSDPAHAKTLSFGNCMLRVPGSHNSKCIRANSILSEKSEVKIIQEWDGRSRPTIMLLVGSFHAYLVDQKLKHEQRDRQQRKREHGTTTRMEPGTISWIEKLLATSIADYRKYCIWRILAPYLINIRKLEDDQATYIIREWLKKCNSVKRVSFDKTSRIRYNIQSVKKKGFYPIGWNQIKSENVDLYNLLKIECGLDTG